TLQTFIQPIKDALYYLWKYPSAMKAWAKFCKQSGRRPIRIPRDIPTRYNLLARKTKKLRDSSSSLNPYFELQSYLDTSFEFMEDNAVKKFDILLWWNEHERYFPILAMIAKQILSTSVSTVAVEQEFSFGGNILDGRCSLLIPQSIQMQACVDDWTKSQNRQQEIDQGAHAPYDFIKDDQPAASGTDDHDSQ
ncbi:hypothetical protein Dsin_017377, partial [Dipteronia sinensis]